MADVVGKNEFDAGAGYIVDRGDWQSGFEETVDGVVYEGYAIQDCVHTSKAIYMSLIDGNTTNPDTDTTGTWRVMVNKKDVNDATSAAKSATESAIEAASEARGEAETARVLTEEGRSTLNELNAGLAAQQAATEAAEQAAKAAQNAAQPKADIAARPATMAVMYKKKVTVGARPVVEVTMQPDTANTSKVFQAWSGCKVTPDGIVVPDGVGTAVFYVVSTINSCLFKKVEIEVVASSNILDENGEAITDENGNPITD